MRNLINARACKALEVDRPNTIASVMVKQKGVNPFILSRVLITIRLADLVSVVQQMSYAVVRKRRPWIDPQCLIIVSLGLLEILFSRCHGSTNYTGWRRRRGRG